MKIEAIQKKITSCKRCPRLIKHCQKVAKEKKREFIGDTYWGRPVPSFGDSKAQVFILGLAPAAHGANRTGRMFTGDNSGLWLYRALFRAGFSTHEKSTHSSDALKLKNAYISATAHCAPPENKPTPKEIENCREYLVDEIKTMKTVKVYLVLGGIAMKALWQNLPESVKPQKAIPKFAHGAEIKLNDGRVLLCSYHPSQQNTFTKRLTEPMFDSIFERTKIILGQQSL